MDTPHVAEVLQAAKAAGASDETLIAILREHGWSDRTARTEVVSFYSQRAGIEIPRRRDSQSSDALDGFLYIFASGTLITWVTASIALFSTLIDQQFPPTRESYYGTGSGIVWALASLITTIPLYLGLMLIIFHRLKTGVTTLRSTVRQWVLSGTLLVGVATIIGYVISYLASLLGGEQTTGSSIKAAFALVLVGGISAYYLIWLSGGKKSKESAR